MNTLTLLLNAAEQRLQFGLARDTMLLCGQSWLAASRGAELLTPALRSALQLLEVSVSDLSRIACVSGPGGFTGLRLVLSTASALHHALNIPLAGISYLHLLAEGVPARTGQTIRVLVNARRNLVYRQDFVCRTDGGKEPASDVSLAAVEDLVPEPDVSSDLPLILVGSGVTRHLEACDIGAGRYTVASGCDQPNWDAFVRLADRATYALQDIVPLYCRASEAEDNLEALAERRGDDPREARQTLLRFLGQEPRSHE